MSEINYSKPKQFKYKTNKNKSLFTNSQKKKILGYLKEPKVQDYVKGLDNSGKIAFADSLIKMQTDKSFKPDILKTAKEKSDKVPSITYTVPKSILHKDVLKLVEDTAGDTLRLSSAELKNLLNQQQKAKGGAKQSFDDKSDTFNYSDFNKTKIKENLQIIQNEIDFGEKPSQEYINEILKIDPSLGDSLMQEINKVKKDPKKDTGDGILSGIGNWATKTLSTIGKAWNDNVENTNNMVKSPPPNLQKDPKEESKDKPQIKKTEKVELEDSLVSSKDTKKRKSLLIDKNGNLMSKNNKGISKIKPSDWNKEPYKSFINRAFGVNVFDSNGNIDPNLYLDSDKYNATGRGINEYLRIKIMDMKQNQQFSKK